MNWEQLDVLKRQVEEDYRLDTQAIERLQRRFQANAGSSAATATATTAATPATAAWPSYMSTPVSDARPAENATVELHPEPVVQPDELTGTLRAMFSGGSRR